MKKELKYLATGFVLGAVLFSSIPALAETAANIDVIFGRVKLVVNGIASNEETILYDGTTYVPIRAAAEILGMDVKYDETTATAHLSTAGGNYESSEKSDSPLVFFDSIQWEIEVFPKNLLNVVTMEMWFTNNSEYPLSYVQLIFKDKNTGITYSVNSAETVMPGEASDINNAFGPDEGGEEALELMEANYTYVDKGSKVAVKYNPVSKSYSFTSIVPQDNGDKEE